MNAFRLSLCALFLFASASASSQEACPGGTQVGQNCGGGYCVPICAYDESPQQTVAPAPRVVERWQVFDARYGAWASDSTDGAMGVSFGELSAEAAERKAIAACHKNGGKTCISPGAFSNVCSSAAWGSGQLVMRAAETAGASQHRALEHCEDLTGASCQTVETVCSLPVSRWVYERPDNFVPAR